MKMLSILFLHVFISFITVACDNSNSDNNTTTSTTNSSAGSIPVYTFEIINIYPHNTNAFTQGLVFDNNVLYEGTGRYYQSSLRKIELKTGEILKILRLDNKYFGEGVTVYKNRIIQLTWQSGIGFVYDKETFKLLHKFTYTTEGWGLTHDETHLIMSDGTSTLYFLDPETFDETNQIEILEEGLPVTGLNELEYIQGEIYANIWQTDLIARISPETGQVTGWINLAGLLSHIDYSKSVDVLNGIAYDNAHDRLFVTGKLWPSLFEIKLLPTN